MTGFDAGAYFDLEKWESELKERHHIGHALAKSTGDYFDYAMGLTSGEVFYFTQARVEGDWVYLTEPTRIGVRIGNKSYTDGEPFFPRGIEIHLSAIAWVADAPYDS